MCIDQQQFVTYDPAFDPRVSTAKPPQFDVKDMVYNWPNPTGAQGPGSTGAGCNVTPKMS